MAVRAKDTDVETEHDEEHYYLRHQISGWFFYKQYEKDDDYKIVIPVNGVCEDVVFYLQTIELVKRFREIFNAYMFDEYKFKKMDAETPKVDLF